MIATVDRAALADAARWVARAIARVPYSPVMAGMIITADDGAVTLRASDLDTSLSCRVDAAVTDPGTLLVPGNAFAGYLTAARGGSVVLSHHADDRTATAAVGRSRSVMHLMNPDEYPKGLHRADEVAATIPAADLIDLVEPLMAHADPNSPHIWAQCVSMEIDHGVLTVTCGTRYALGAATIPLEGELSIMVLASQLAPVLPGLTGDVTIRHLQGYGPVTFETADREVQLRMIGENYPDTSPLFDKPRPFEAQVDHGALSAAVRLAATGTDRVGLRIESDLITVTSHRPEKGELTGVITDEIECVAGADAEIVISAHYLINALASMRDGGTTIHYAAGASRVPIMITDQTSRHVIGTVRQGGTS